MPLHNVLCKVLTMQQNNAVLNFDIKWLHTGLTISKWPLLNQSALQLVKHQYRDATVIEQFTPSHLHLPPFTLFFAAKTV